MTPTEQAPSPRRQLGMKLLAYILLVSSLVTLLLTAWQLWSDYQRDVSSIEERLGILEQTTLEPLTNSIWALNEDQVSLLLTGMMNLGAVVGVELVTDQGRIYRLGVNDTSGPERRYPLTYRNPRQGGQPYALGTLTVYTSLDGVIARLKDRAANILVGQAIKTFIVSLFIIAIVQHLVTRHLGTIADYARQLSLNNLQQPLRLNRPGQAARREPDELDQVETAINYMRETLIEDSAQRAAAERRLSQSEARYRQLFEASIDGLAIFDLEGRLLTANPAYLGMVGYTLEEARHLTFRQLSPEKWSGLDQSIIDDQILTRGYSDIYEKEYIHRDGHVFPVSIRGWLIRDEAGQPQFLTGFVRDISREKQLAAEREQLEQQLRESQRMETVGRLAGGIAHDFNNILTPIRGYSELMARENPDNATIKTRSDAIFHAAERGRKLVEQILLFSRKGHTNYTTVDLAQVVRETLELAALTRPPNVQVRVDIGSADTQLSGDSTQLHQLVLNLVFNAFHALRGKGGSLQLEITPAISPLDGRTAGWQLAVVDTGCGIAPEHLGKIFEPFFTTRETGQGNGLGLSVVHGIVKGHGGDIAVQSGPEGTRFTIWLPRADAGQDS